MELSGIAFVQTVLDANIKSIKKKLEIETNIDTIEF